MDEEDPLGVKLLRSWGPLQFQPRPDGLFVTWKPADLGVVVELLLVRLPGGGFAMWSSADPSGDMVEVASMAPQSFKTPDGVVLEALFGNPMQAWKVYWGLAGWQTGGGEGAR